VTPNCQAMSPVTVGRVARAKVGAPHTYTATYLGPPETWAASGGGYPDSLALATLDTIFSVGANDDRVVAATAEAVPRPPDGRRG